jgi:outer membrane protein OmpU
MSCFRPAPLVIVVLLLGVAMLPGIARAQDFVSIYGLADVSVKVISNYAGGRRIGQDSGDQQGPRLGFQGSETLGGGVRTIFLAETGFNLDTGGFAQGGVPFGRQDYLGFSTPWGTLTAGRQYDFMTDMGAYHAVWQGTGSLDWNLGDNDRTSGQRLDNSIKYMFKTPSVGAGAMYSRSESTGTTRSPSASSYLGSYTGDHWSMAAGATLLRNAPVAPYASLGVPEFFGMPTLSTQGAPAPFVADRIDIFAVGATWNTGAWTLLGLTTQTRYARSTARERIQNGNLAVRYGASDGLVYTLNLSGSWLNATSAKRVAFSQDWFLSKRTDLYVFVVAERAEGAGARAVLFTAAPSSDGRQLATAVGVRHRF